MSVSAATTAALMTTATASMTKALAFVGTNTEKVKDGQIMRVPIVIGQGVNAYQSYAQSGLAGANKAQAGAELLGKAAEKSTFLARCGGVLKWIQGHINPLITACVGVKIFMSEDKERALWSDGTGLVAMFASEKAYKKLSKTDTAKTIFNQVENFGNKIFKASKGSKAGKVCAAVAEGLGFVVASVGGYTGAAKIGGAVLDDIREEQRKRFEKFGYMC